MSGQDHVTLTFRPLRCDTCRGPVPFLTAMPGTTLAEFRPLLRCHRCVIQSGERSAERVSQELRKLGWMDRLMWLDDPSVRPDLTMFGMRWEFRDIPGGASYAHLQAEVCGVFVDEVLDDLEAMPVPAWRTDELAVVFPFVQITSDRHGVALRHWANLASGTVRADLLNIEFAKADEMSEMRAALDLLNAHYDGRGAGTGSGIALERDQIIQAIRSLDRQDRKISWDAVRAEIWPNGGGLADRQFRERVLSLFPGRSWPEVKLIALAGSPVS